MDRDGEDVDEDDDEGVDEGVMSGTSDFEGVGVGMAPITTTDQSRSERSPQASLEDVSVSCKGLVAEKRTENTGCTGALDEVVLTLCVTWIACEGCEDCEGCAAKVG